jgi:glycosyltransferase involved in cell wall biosynthesis
MEQPKLSIIIISEDGYLQQQISQALSKPELTISFALNRTEALEKITTQEPQIIIVDAGFSEKSQQNLIQHLQSFTSSPHFIVIDLESKYYEKISAIYDWKTGISYVISLQEITQEVAEFQKRINPEPTQLRNIDGLPEESRRPIISVVIPTLNEAKNLPHLLPYLPMDWIDEVVLVDGRSTDNTIEVAKQLLPSIVVIEEKRHGKGIAMQSGFYASTGDIIITLDADGSNDPREIPRMITALLEGADMVKGTRFTSGGGTNDMSTVRKLGNKGLITLTNILFRASFTDLCYGYHAFWRYCLDQLDLSSQTGFEIDTGMYIQAWNNHLRLVETPSFEGYRFHGEGKLQTWKDGWRVLKQILTEKQSQMRSSPREEYLGFRGARPTFLYAPAYKNIYNDFYKIAFSKSLFLQNDVAQLSKEGIFESANLENTRFLFQMLYLVSTTISKIDYFDLEKLLGHILEQVVHILDASSGSIVVLNEKGVPPESYTIYNSQVYPVTADQLSDTLENGLAGWVVKNQQPVLLADTSEDYRWVKHSWERTGSKPRSALSVPLTTNDSVVGVLTLARPQVRKFTYNDLRIANSMTD